MQKWFILMIALTWCNAALKGQTLVSEIGPITYFNSLDSAKSEVLNKLARRCYCFEQLIDPSHQVHLKLDLATSSDTFFYQLGYNNLYGNYFTFPDSAARQTAGNMYADAGVYIKARDTAISEKHLLLLIDYGIAHFRELKKRGEEGNSFDAAFISQLFRQKPSPKIVLVPQQCK